MLETSTSAPPGQAELAIEPQLKRIPRPSASDARQGERAQVRWGFRFRQRAANARHGVDAPGQHERPQSALRALKRVPRRTIALCFLLGVSIYLTLCCLQKTGVCEREYDDHWLARI